MLTIASKMIVFGKRFSILIIVLTFFCSSNALAMNLVSCDVDNVPQCAIYLKKINIQDEVSYDAQLTSKETNKPIFTSLEESTTMENLSLKIFNGQYVFMKESSASGKGVEFITFDFNNEKVEGLKYFYLDSYIDVKNKRIVWNGEECLVDDKKDFSKEGYTLFRAIALPCMSKDDSRSYFSSDGKNVIFNMKKVNGGKYIGETKVIALDSAQSEYLNAMDVGCIEGCDINNAITYYIGKIRDKYRISLAVSNEGGEVIGYYYYEKVSEKINLKGVVSGNEFLLKTDSGELFKGNVDKDKVTGVWSNSQGDRSYTFKLYKSIMQ